MKRLGAQRQRLNIIYRITKDIVLVFLSFLSSYKIKRGEKKLGTIDKALGTTETKTKQNI